MHRKRARVLDSRGRPVRGLYVRDGDFYAGFQLDGRWQMKKLQADSLTEARRERESLIAGLQEGRIAARTSETFAETFAEYQEARSLAERTRKHEQHLVNRHLGELNGRRVQDVTASEIARLLRGMREAYSPWTRVAVYRILRGTFALALRRGIVTRSPLDGLADSERPRQKNKRKVARLDDATIAKLIAAASSERYQTAIGLAGYAGLRLGEFRALQWQDVDFKAETISVLRAAEPDGTLKAPKTEAGTRTIPMLPALKRLLLVWNVRSPKSAPSDLVICTVDGKPMQERNLARAFNDAKKAAGLDATEARLSWHSLRHSYGSLLATNAKVAPTTLARLIGHADAGFTLKVYARDNRDDAAVTADVLALTREAGVGV
jgi:integrase